MLPHVHHALQHRYASFCDATLEDAVATAVECFLTRAPDHVVLSPSASRQWLIQVAVYALYHERRRVGRNIARDACDALLDRLPSADPADRMAEQSQLWELLVERLGASTAETVWLHEIEHCTPRDIAALQRIGVAAVKARITRARKTLRLIFHHADNRGRSR